MCIQLIRCFCCWHSCCRIFYSIALHQVSIYYTSQCAFKHFITYHRFSSFVVFPSSYVDFSLFLWTFPSTSRIYSYRVLSFLYRGFLFFIVDFSVITWILSYHRYIFYFHGISFHSIIFFYGVFFSFYHGFFHLS